ncbi:efflux transporter periplasmic adaptor subunit [Vibrio breoganii]|uniref:Efflux transporter periplasmic adaptor subunit n=1 Tax=Vibrio breoganii TaxID=553239 RepID=A0AAP8MV14_9VIBR|nr:efflux RND transporter periplasmic adaptor subunit [Vibrio breoganii]PMP07843.1 efflux transporter periplasmic adaptor subunit [Vibrio breoganii]
MKKYALIAVILSIAGFSAFSLHTTEKEAPTLSSALTVDTTFAGQDTLERSVHMLGNTFAHQSVDIKPEEKGKVSKVLVKSGEEVKKGQLLFLLDDRHQRAVVQREAASLKELQRQHSNLLRLLPNGAVPQGDVDAALANVEMQKAELDLAKATLQDKRVTAPFSGTLGLVDITIGQNVESESVLTTLDDSSHLRLNVALPAKYLRQLKVGQTTKLSSIEGAKSVKATLTSLDSRVNSQTQNIQVQFRIDNDEADLTPGSLVLGELPLPTQAEVTVPLQSVVYRGHERFVYVVQESKVEKRHVEKRIVTLGERTGEKVQVLEGLEIGEEIVYRGTVKLRENAEVEVNETVDTHLPSGDV